MCGAFDSVIGMDTTISIDKFIHQLPARHQPVRHPEESVIGAVMIGVDPKTNHIKTIETIHRVYNNERN